VSEDWFNPIDPVTHWPKGKKPMVNPQLMDQLNEALHQCYVNNLALRLALIERGLLTEAEFAHYHTRATAIADQHQAEGQAGG
jgi:hypothetical protein